jgi:hypothetical protein
MKNRLLVVGVLIMTVALGIGLTGCPEGSPPEMTKFEGTWVNAGTSEEEGTWRIVYTFTNYAFAGTSKINNDAQSSFSGTFSFTSDTITFIPATGDAWTQGYTLIFGTLKLDPHSEHFRGTFIKQL